MTAKSSPRFYRLQLRTTRSSHYVCFQCRRQFAKPVDVIGSRGWTGKSAKVVAFDAGTADYTCPTCAEPLTHMGKNFRAPAQDDVESWEIARRLASAGYKHTWTAGHRYPTSLKDVKAFLDQHRDKSEGEQLLDRWKDKS